MHVARWRLGKMALLKKWSALAMIYQTPLEILVIDGNISSARDLLAGLRGPKKVIRDDIVGGAHSSQSLSQAEEMLA